MYLSLNFCHKFLCAILQVIQGHRPIVLMVQHSTTFNYNYSSDNKVTPCLYSASKTFSYWTSSSCCLSIGSRLCPTAGVAINKVKTLGLFSPTNAPF